MDRWIERERGFGIYEVFHIQFAFVDRERGHPKENLLRIRKKQRKPKRSLFQCLHVHGMLYPCSLLVFSSMFP